jgi:hypothetical protein
MSQPVPLTVADVKDLVLRHGAEFAVVLAYFDGPGLQYVTYGVEPDAKVCASDLSEQISDCINRGHCPSMNPATGPAKVLESFKLEAGRIKAENERFREAVAFTVRTLDLHQDPAANPLAKAADRARAEQMLRAALGPSGGR